MTPSKGSTTAVRLAESWYSTSVVETTRMLAHPLLRLGYFYRSRGTSYIPKSGPAILAPNHVSYLDPLLVSYVTRRPVYYLAWKNLFLNPVFARMIRAMGAIPVDTDLRSDRQAYTAALRVLGQGDLLCIFPEGIRGWDGRLNPLQQGVARLAVSSGAPIIPMTIRGALEAWPRWKILPRLFVPITVEILPPIQPARVTTKRAQREASDQLMQTLEKELLTELG